LFAGSDVVYESNLKDIKKYYCVLFCIDGGNGAGYGDYNGGDYNGGDCTGVCDGDLSTETEIFLYFSCFYCLSLINVLRKFNTNLFLIEVVFF
jgi:hypothetical protein